MINYTIIENYVIQQIDSCLPMLSKAINARSPLFDSCLGVGFSKNTACFYHFHSKKWSIKILLYFLQSKPYLKPYKIISNNYVMQWTKYYSS